MVSRVILVSPVEELAVAAHRADALDQQIEIPVFVREIQALGVHDQDRHSGEMIEEAVVAVGEQGEVFRGDRSLEFYAAAAHTLDQGAGLRLEIDHEVGTRRLRLERVEDLLVQVQLVPVEREAREQRVLLEQEIAHRDAAEQVELRQLAQLRDPLEEEEELSRQREPRHVLVEPRQKGILLRALEHEVRLYAGGKAPREAGLADAYRTFDDDVAILERHRDSRNRRP